MTDTNEYGYEIPEDTEEDDYIDDNAEDTGEDVNYDDEIAVHYPTDDRDIYIHFYLDGVKLASYYYTKDCHGAGETTITSVDGQTVTATRGYILSSTTYTGESYTFTYPRAIESEITIGDDGEIYATSHFDSLIIPMTSKNGVFLNTGGSYNDKNIIINPRMESVTVTPTIKKQIVTPTDGKVGIETVTVKAISPDELIIDVDELPTSDVATNTYYRMGGALYRYGLLNTRWVLNEELDYSGLETSKVYYFTGSVLGNPSQDIRYLYNGSSSLRYLYCLTAGNSIGAYSYVYYESTNSSSASSGGSYSYIGYYTGGHGSYIGGYSKTSDTGVSLRTLDITGGDDIYNQTLVDWFLSNATLTSGSMWTKYLVPVPEGTQSITENGTYDISEKANVEVNVPIPDGYIQPSGSITITENGTTDVTDKAEVVVNVEGTGGGDIIEVEELPETGEEDVVYKKSKFISVAVSVDGEYYEDVFGEMGFPITNIEYYYVATKPTEDIKVSSEVGVYFYYVEDENEIYAYGDFDDGGTNTWLAYLQELLGGELQCKGTTTSINSSSEDGYYAFLAQSMHQYKDGTWVNFIVPSGGATVNENGTHDVADKAEVSVKVPAMYVVQNLANLPTDAPSGSVAYVLRGE